MDTKQLSEAFETLKSLFANRDSGRQWEGAAKARPPVTASDGWESGADEATIVQVAEETAIAALGISGQYRFRAKDSFACSANPVTEPHRLGQLALDGRQFYLGQILIANRHSWLLGQRCLLAHGDHAGRRLKVSFKLHDGYNQFGTYQVAHESTKAYSIVRHGAAWLELDQIPESSGTGYLFLTF
jgi:hypothetical protein